LEEEERHRKLAAASAEEAARLRAEQERLNQEKEVRQKAAEEAEAAAKAAGLAKRIEESNRKAEAAKELAKASNKSEAHGHKKVLGMWVNDKLVKFGNPPIDINRLEYEFQDGTTLAHLLEGFTGEPIKGIDWKPGNGLQRSANCSILWSKMRNELGMPLGGINATNVMKDDPVEKTVLHLIWQMVLKFEVEDGNDDLMAWVQPRAAPRKNVTGYQKEWADGEAFLALAESFGFKKGQPQRGVDPLDDTLNQVFKFFYDQYGVPMILDPDDLKGPADMDYKHNIQTYLATVKNASKKAEGDEATKLLNSANAYYAQAVSEGHNKVKELLDTAETQMGYMIYDNPDGVDEIIAKTLNDLDAINPKFIIAKDTYGKAKDAFVKQKTKEGNENAAKCKDKENDCISQPDSMRNELQDELEKLKNAWAIKAGFEEAERIKDKTAEDLESMLKELNSWAVSEVPKCTSEGDYSKLLDNAMNIMKEKSKPFDDARNLCDKVAHFSDDDAVADEAANKKSAIDDLEDEYQGRVQELISKAIKDHEANKDTSEDDVLKIYHDFSTRCEGLVKKLSVPSSEADKTPGKAQERLDGLMRLVKMHLQRDLNLRQQLHIEIDETFTQEGLP